MIAHCLSLTCIRGGTEFMFVNILCKIQFIASHYKQCKVLIFLNAGMILINVYPCKHLQCVD